MMEVPPNETPEAVKSLFDTTTELLSSYGWPLLFLIVVLNLLWSHFEPKYRKWQEKLEDQKKEEECKRNPELALVREEGLARARQKMQERLDELSREHAQKMKEKEEKKRQEKIENYEKLLGLKPSSNKPQKLRGGDYNPLAGSGGSCSYRPSRQRGGSGGG